jgi:hypothetical protein
VVDAHHIGGHGVFTRSGDHNALGPRCEMLLSLFQMGKTPRGLYNVVDTEILPRQLGGILFSTDGYFMRVYKKGLFIVRDRMRIGAMNGIMLEKVGQMVGRDQVVYSYNLKGAGAQRLS